MKTALQTPPSRPHRANLANSCWAYDAQIILRQIQRLRQFDVIRFAQNPAAIPILRLMREQGVLVDAVSLGEIERALAAGYQAGRGQQHAEIVLTADVLDHATLARGRLNIPVNCGSPDMLPTTRLKRTLAMRSGCVSIPGLAMVTAIKPILAASTANTASGTNSSAPRWN